MDDLPRNAFFVALRQLTLRKSTLMTENLRIQSSRLALVFPTERAFPALFIASHCDQFVRNLGFGPARTLAGMRRNLAITQAAWRADERYTFDVWDKGNTDFIGRVRISANERGRCRLGYFVVPRYWRQGYGLEMVKRAVDLAFDTLGADRVEAVVETDNRASLALLSRLGMTPTAPVDTPPARRCTLALRREDW